MVEINKLDNKKIHIVADRKIIIRLDKHFSRLVPNHNFIESVKNKMWDGRIRKLNPDNTLPLTLIYDLVDFLKTNKIEYKLNFKPENNLDKTKFKNWIVNNLVLPFEPRDYQFLMAYDLLRYKNVLAESLTASGKSYSSYLICRTMIHMNKKCVFVVPSIDLMKQLMNDFKSYKFKEADETIQLMGDKFTDKDFNKNILITTWQSLRAKRYKKFEECFRKNSIVSDDKLKKVKLQVKDKIKKYQVKSAIKLLKTYRSYFKDFKTMIEEIVEYENKIIADFKTIDCVVFDEAHKCKGVSVQGILKLASNAKYVMGMTGTVDDIDSLSVLELKSLYGRHDVYNTYPDLIEAKIINDFYVNLVTINYPDHIKRDFYLKTKDNWREEYYYLSGIKERNQLILDIINKHEGSGIVIYEFIQEGDNLEEFFKDKIDCKVLWMDGKRKKDIKKLVDIKEMTERIIIFGSDKTVGTGLNIPQLDFGISTSSVNDSKGIRQRIGRIIRRSKLKSKCSTFYDLNDNMVLRSGNSIKINKCITHSENRRKVYDYFKIKVKEETVVIDIKDKNVLF